MQVIHKSDFISPKQAAVEFEIPGKVELVILPCTFDPNYHGSFELSILCTDKLAVTKLNPPKSIDLPGEWKGQSAGGCFNHPTWIYNPQFQLIISSSCKIQLSQPTDDFSIGFYVFKSDGDHLLIPDTSKFVTKSKFIQAKTTVIELKATSMEQTYTIIPCTFHPNQESTFTLSVFSDEACAFLPANYAWKSLSFDNHWKHETAGGCFDFATWRNNPQFEFQAQASSKGVCIIEQFVDVNKRGKLNSIGCYLVKQNDPGQYIWQESAKEHILTKAPFKRSKTIQFSFNVKKGEYYCLIPTCYRPFEEGTFKIQLFLNEGDKDVKMHLLENNALGTGQYCEGEWEGETAGGSMNSSTWPNNPHYLLYVDENEPTEALIVLSQLSNSDHPIGFTITRADSDGLPFVEKLEDIVARSNYEESAGKILISPLSFHNSIY